MDKTETFFVISNFNTIPKQYLEYCNNYIIYDQSTDKGVVEQLTTSEWNVSFVEHTGHNLSDYFRYIINHFDSLPNYVMFLKGNIIGRHLSKNYFDKVYQNNFFTPLYSDEMFKDSVWSANLLFEGTYLEINMNWYADSKSHDYFRTYNQLLKFIFVNPIIPKWLIFSPGGCYILPKENITKYPKVFYQNLYYLVSYRFFPSEAYHIERMMQVIFTGNYVINEHMLNSASFFEELKKIKSKLKYQIIKKDEEVYTLKNLLNLLQIILFQKMHNWKSSIKKYLSI